MILVEMRMPQNCLHCPFSSLSHEEHGNIYFHCEINDINGEKAIVKNNFRRPKECPLVYIDERDLELHEKYFTWKSKSGSVE